MSSTGVTPLSKWARQHTRIRNEYVNGFIGEFCGTFILCLFAVGAGVTRNVFGEGQLMGTFGGVFGLMTAVTVLGGLSSNINPAVSLGFAIVGRISWIKVPIYWSGQLLGAYTAAGLAYGIYASLMRTHIEGDLSRTITDEEYYREIAGIFSPLPSLAPFWICFADQVVSTAVFFIAIMAGVDRRNNMNIPTYLFGLYLALVVAGVSFTFGRNAGGSMNPARDLGPRMMAITIGCDSKQVLQNAYGDPYWLAILFGPLVGSTIGAFVYVFLIGSHFKDTEEEKEKATLQQGGDSDWMSTVHPKRNQPSGPKINSGGPYGNGASYTNGGPIRKDGSISNGLTHYAGVRNPGYIRDEPRQRQY